MNAIQRLQHRFPPRNAVDRPGPTLGSGLDVIGGCEHRTPHDAYRWDGLRRGGSSKRPIALLQYTLDGRGAIDFAGRTFAVPAEHCLIAIIPSRHVYYLPEDSASWSFIWTMVNHPYVVRRLRELIASAGPVVSASAGSELPEALGRLIEASADDALAREEKLLALMLAAHRAADASRPGADERQRLLTRVHQLVRAADYQRPNIEAVAAEFGMSRSNFSHHFRATTGLSPAAFVREVRLERAREAVVGSDASLKAVARQFGFADANHFGKVFSERFGFTPLALRRQTRGRWPTR